MSEKLDAMFGADAADYIRQLQAEIEQLRTLADTRDMMLKQLRAQFDDMVRQRNSAHDKLADAAAFLDGLAKRLDDIGRYNFPDALNGADECRAKARELRGEEFVGIHEDKDDPDYKADIAKLRGET